jgi:hypothetical protein
MDSKRKAQRGKAEEKQTLWRVGRRKADTTKKSRHWEGWQKKGRHYEEKQTLGGRRKADTRRGESLSG